MRGCPVSFRLAIAVAGACLLAACGSGAPSERTGQSSAKGVAGVSFTVTVFRSLDGTVTSTDGQINCGIGGTACTGNYAWTATATLNATPKPGLMLGSWNGDCSGNGACVLNTANNGADKFVVPAYGPAGTAQHGNFTTAAVHGPAYLDFVAGVPGAFTCSAAACHGASLNGVGIAPSCNACHLQNGWTGWQTNCSFCHGAKTPAAKAGYVVADHADWAAPPDAVSQRLTGVAAPARTGAHAAHLTGVSANGTILSPPFRCETCHAVPSNLTHIGGSASRATVALSAASQGTLPSPLGTYDGATCTTYCHRGASPAWGSGITTGCTSCHGAPPPAPHPNATLTQCTFCHPSTVKPDHTIDPAGTHVNGHIDVIAGGACDACHGFPPATGAHVKHFGLPAADFPSGYGDTRTLQDRVTGVTPVTAPGVYGFGCGSCHPFDGSKHLNGVADVELYDASAPAGNPKRLSSPAWTYNAAAKTCSGTYCHSSGQASPTFVATPGWASGAHLACDGCHANPPRYDTGGAGTATANSHVNLATDGYEFGHFLGVPGPWHPGQNKHGKELPGQDAAPITCQTCHADTTDPSATGPSGFYWLDTTGNYQLPGGTAARVGTAWYQRLQCTSCHAAGNATAPAQAGRVLPLRHVNGKRDVVFDPRPNGGSLSSIPWLPAAPNTPAAPYWLTGASQGLPWPAYVTFNGTTVSFPVSPSAYDTTTKSCSNVACHMAETPTWGTRESTAQCTSCHPPHFR